MNFFLSFFALTFLLVACAPQPAPNPHEGHTMGPSSSEGIDLIVEPATPEAGEPATLHLMLTSPTGPLVAVKSHERYVHVITVSDDFSEFTHTHADDSPDIEQMVASGHYAIPHTFNKGGEQLVAIDFATKDMHYAKQFVVSVLGANRTEVTGLPETTQTFSGYGVTLNAQDLIAGKEAHLEYTIQKDGKPIELEQYLAADMHIAVVKEDFGSFVHAHGEKIAQSVVDAHVTFPSTGTYHVFGEFQHEGKVILTHFVVDVTE